MIAASTLLGFLFSECLECDHITKVLAVMIDSHVHRNPSFSASVLFLTGVEKVNKVRGDFTRLLLHHHKVGTSTSSVSHVVPL